jgi:hypothetical protein
MRILLPFVTFLSWFTFLLVPAGKLAIEDELKNVPKDKRRGTSILPGFPVFPLVAWAGALAVDHFFSVGIVDFFWNPWGAAGDLPCHYRQRFISSEEDEDMRSPNMAVSRNRLPRFAFATQSDTEYCFCAPPSSSAAVREPHRSHECHEDDRFGLNTV